MSAKTINETDFTTIRVLKTTMLHLKKRNVEHIAQIDKYVPLYETLDKVCQTPLVKKKQ